MGAFVDLDTAVAVITGAGSGIGRATALSLARRGSRIVVTDVDEARAVAVAAEVAASGGEAIAVRCDVSQLSDLEVVRDAALERFGHVDVVMNNVGVMALGPVGLIPLDEWLRIIDINLVGIVRSNLVFLQSRLRPSGLTMAATRHTDRDDRTAAAQAEYHEVMTYPGPDPTTDAHAYAALKSGDLSFEELQEVVLHFATYEGWLRGAWLDDTVVAAWARVQTETGGS